MEKTLDIKSIRRNYILTRTLITTIAVILVFTLTSIFVQLVTLITTGLIFIFLGAVLLYIFRMWWLAGRLMRLPSTILTYLTRVLRHGFGFRHRLTPDLVKQLQQHAKVLGSRIPSDGELEVGYTVSRLQGLKRLKLPYSVINQGLLIIGDKAEEVTALLLPQIKKAVIVGRGEVPLKLQEGRSVRFYGLGKNHAFNPFDYDGSDIAEAKIWADKLATSIAAAGRLEYEDATMLSNFFTETKLKTPTSMVTLDWIEEIDTYTGVYRASPIKGILRRLFVGLDSISGRGDITIANLKKELENVDIVYLDVGLGHLQAEIQNRVYAFISTYLLFSAYELGDIPLIIYNAELAAPHPGQFGSRTRHILADVVNAVKRRRNFVLVSRSPLVAPALYNVANVIVTHRSDVEGQRILARVFGLSYQNETLLSDLHTQEAIAKIQDRRGPIKTVFAYNPPFLGTPPEQELGTEKKLGPIDEGLRRTLLYKDYEEDAEKIYHLLGYVKFRNEIPKEDLAKEYPESKQYLDRLLELGYLERRENLLHLTMKGAMTLNQWEDTTKRHEEETHPAKPQPLQPTITTYEQAPIPLPEELRILLHNAEDDLFQGSIKRSVQRCWMFIHRSLKLLANIEKANTQELITTVRLKGYQIDGSTIMKAYGIFVNVHQGRGTSETEARFCLDVAKKIAAIFPEPITERTEV